MKRKKLIITSSITLLLVIAFGGGSFLTLELTKNKNKTSDNSSNIDGVADTSSTSGLSSGLSVNSGNSLGQLNNNSSSSSTNGSSSSSSSGSSVDPSTFSQYEKYASSTTSLFADLNKGTGQTLADNQTVSIAYQGYLTNGTMFGESGTSSDPDANPLSFTFGSNTIITGLQEGMAGMKVGGQRLIIVPPSLGYGATPPSGSNIPANSVLVFVVSLLSAK